MHATKGGFIVMYAPDKTDYHDENATVRVGLRSIDGNPPITGYGLVVHGEKKDGKLEDYGFPDLQRRQSEIQDRPAQSRR